MVGNDGYHPLIFEQVSIFGQNALTSIFKSCVIRHLHISHDAPNQPHKILHNLCSSFPLGITVVPREIENNAYEKFWDANKMHYGRCASGVSTNFTLLKNLQEVLAWVLLKTCKQIRKAVFMHIVQLQKHLK